MIEKLAPENENKRELDTRQVLAGDAARAPHHCFFYPLVFGTRTRTSFTRERERDPAAPVPSPGHVNKEVEKTWPGNENEDHAASGG